MMSKGCLHVAYEGTSVNANRALLEEFCRETTTVNYLRHIQLTDRQRASQQALDERYSKLNLEVNSLEGESVNKSRQDRVAGMTKLLLWSSNKFKVTAAGSDVED